MITIAASTIPTRPTAADFAPAIRLHMANLPVLSKLRRYYLNNTDILARVRPVNLPNERLAFSFSSYIIDISASYLLGEPVRYELDTDKPGLVALRNLYAAGQADSVDIDLALNQSLFGRATSLCFIGPAGLPRTCSLDPRFSFVVYDDTVMHLPICGIFLSDTRLNAPFTVYLPNRQITFNPADRRASPAIVPHPFPFVPMVDYLNNSFERSDVSGVMSLIDAYNLLGSDRINDRQQFSDALLVLTGFMGLGSDPAEEAVAFARLRSERVLNLPDADSTAAWLTKPSTERDIEALRNALADDIHKLSQTPDFSDDNFAGTSSGIAIRYKLFNFDSRTRMKERFFLDGLRNRARLMAAWLFSQKSLSLDVDNLRIKLTRRLPVDELDRSKTIKNLVNVVDPEVLTDNSPLLIDEHN